MELETQSKKTLDEIGNEKETEIAFINELAQLGFSVKDEKYVDLIPKDTFDSKEFSEFKEKQSKLYKKNGIPIITNLMLIITDKIKIDWIKHLRSQNLKNSYEEQIINKLENQDLLSSNGKYTIAGLIAGDDDLSLKVLSKEQMEFCKNTENLVSENNFLDLKVLSKEQIEFCKNTENLVSENGFLDLKVPNKFLSKETQEDLIQEHLDNGLDEEIFKNIDFTIIRISKTDPVNDIIIYMDSVKDFHCNGESSYFLSVDEMSNWAKENNIQFSDIYTGWEY